MTTLIQNGTLVDPKNKVYSQLNLLMENGKISYVGTDCPPADVIVDATGKLVTPGFIDIHLHEDPIDAAGNLVKEDKTAMFNCMLRMGVTTALGGQCGISRFHPSQYLDIIDRDGASINVAMLAGHTFFRELAGATDKYAPITPEQMERMLSELTTALDDGCLGVSYGVRYVPGTSQEEILETARLCQKDNKLIAAHLRDDAEAIFSATAEFVDVGKGFGLPMQISHIGSMAGFGQMKDFLAQVDAYRLEGFDVTCDCYPYNAFSTTLGATTYDEGWNLRYHCGYDAIELCEGDYKGMRCTEEIFHKVRAEYPDCVTVGHLMPEDQVDMALTHPHVMLASDGLMNAGQGHPRAAGTFTRLIAKYVRSGKLSIYDAINMMTAMPAQKMGLAHKGGLEVGADADVVVFDLETIQDHATFQNPIAPSTGIDCVFIAGELAMEQGNILRFDLGKSVRK